MQPQVLLFIVAWTLLADLVFVPILRRAFPERFTVRFLLLATTVLAVFLGLCMALASR
jgi:hypothetical protein